MVPLVVGANLGFKRSRLFRRFVFRHCVALSVGLMQQALPALGHHTLGIESKGGLSTGVDRMLVGNRVGVGLTRSTFSSFAPI